MLPTRISNLKSIIQTKSEPERSLQHAINTLALPNENQNHRGRPIRLNKSPFNWAGVTSSKEGIEIFEQNNPQVSIFVIQISQDGRSFFSFYKSKNKNLNTVFFLIYFKNIFYAISNPKAFFEFVYQTKKYCPYCFSKIKIDHKCNYRKDENFYKQRE